MRALDRLAAEWEAAGVAVRFGEPMGPRTWFGVGGEAAVFVEPADEAALTAVVTGCWEAKAGWCVLGSGANLLVLDGGVDAAVVSLSAAAWRSVDGLEGEAGAGGEVVVTAWGGADLMKLVLRTAKAGLAGLEGLAGVPATLGGAVRMNAGGAFGVVGPAVRRVRVMDADGVVRWVERSEMRFGYRRGHVGAPLILAVELGLTPGEPEELVRRVKEVFAYKKASQPMGDNSAGCAFKNPKGAMPDAVAGWGAGKLIDAAGLKGLRIGCASVSEVHANFISVDQSAKSGGGRADDVLALIERVAEAVESRFGVRLERELVVWGRPRQGG
ncbi:MAG: UDP-N-acetylmuramate dehydrogenase [Planctomycetota bacterium]